MSRDSRPGSGAVLAAGLSGFALGAATVLLVVWGYGAGHRAPGDAAGGASGATIGTAAGTAPERSPTAAGGRAARPAPSPDVPPSYPRNAPTAPTTPPAPNAAGGPGTLGAAGAGAAMDFAADVEALRQRRLLLPVQGVRPEQLNDTFADGRGDHPHEALDIMAQRNTPVLAVEDGRLTKLFVSRLGGNTIYQFDPGQTYAYYYAHLERYADGIHEGDMLRRGQVIGYVGTSGDAPANAPHLHFAIFRLTADKHWWQGAAIDPYPILRLP